MQRLGKQIVVIKRYRQFRFGLFSFALLLTALVAQFTIPRAAAQTNNGLWSTPVNLSHSGSTTDPSIVVDSEGGIHVIWVDAFAGTLYSIYNGDHWSAPIPVTYPFGDKKPQLVAGKDGLVFAFWVNQNGVLYYSFVRAENFASPTQWAEPRWLADTALVRSITVDSQGRIHLVYIRTLETFDSPAGVYYQRLDASSFKWTTPKQLYSSPYFRGLAADQANIQVATADTDGVTRVFVVWDNRPRKMIMLSSSQDGGKTWNGPIEIVKPENNSLLTNPFNIRVGISSGKVLLIWQDGEPSTSCTQYYQWSIDGGSSWSDRHQMLEDISGCAQDNKILVSSDELFILESWFQDRVYLLALSESQWSPPQAQDVLNNFTNPETYGTVNFGCQQTIVQGEKRQLLVVGCDEGAATNLTNENPSEQGQVTIGPGDIWFMSRPLGALYDWFPKESTWSNPTIIANGMLTISSPILIADAQEQVHAFWTQLVDGSSASSVSDSTSTNAIYYSRWNGDSWSLPPVLLTPPDEDVSQPSTTIDGRGRLLAVWAGGDGKIYFSLAESRQATSVSDWATPRALPSPRPLSRSPNVLVDKSGDIYVAYAIPLNEERGIYLTLSKDDGKTWSQPTQIFNGAAAGWEMVERPILALTGDENLHIMWTRSTIPFGTGSQALYYARSTNGGQTWSEALEVVEKHFVWSNLVGLDDGILHRLWQEDSTEGGQIRHQYSTDNGVTWSRPISIASFSGNAGPVAFSVDSAGGLAGRSLEHDGKSRSQQKRHSNNIFYGCNHISIRQAGSDLCCIR
jgi:hypothetical protein